MKHGSFFLICIILHLTDWNFMPHFLAQHPNWSLSFWSFSVSSASLISQYLANTIISKVSSFRINVCWDIINVQRQQQGTKDSALWDTRQNQSPIWFCSVYNNFLLSVAQKRIYPFQCLPTYATAKRFALKELMWCVSNAFSKSKMNVSTCPPLSKILTQSFITIINLSFTTVPFSKCMLSIW